MSDRVDGIFTEEFDDLLQQILDLGEQVTEAIHKMPDERRETTEIALIGEMAVAFASAIDAARMIAMQP